MGFPKKIPISLSQRWRLVRYQMLPIGVFFGCVFAVIWIWRQQAALSGLSGHFMTKVAEPASTISGRIAILNTELLQEVHEGEVLAELDRTALDNDILVADKELAVAKANIESLKAELKANGFGLGFDRIRELHDLLVHVEELNLEDIRVTREFATSTITNTHNQREYKRIKEHVEKKTLLKYELIKIGHLLNLSKKNVELLKVELAKIKADIKLSQTRIEMLPNLPKQYYEKRIKPLLVQEEVVQAKIKLLKDQSELYKVICPIDGIITAIHRHTKDSVQAGQPIVTISSKKVGMVVAYVRANQNYRPQVGTKVELQYRFGPRDIIPGKILHVGPDMVDLESRHRADHTVPEWAVPVYIEPEWPTGVKEKINPRPGELLIIRVLPANKQS